ncbi:MAG: hypothetical protein IPG92_00185 [Flavobacteriales bacterium]|nr:hypothetical protein [Flavobacteriales bacterium]
MGGIATALKHARYSSMLVPGCDMPHVTAELFITLKEGRPRSTTPTFRL